MLSKNCFLISDFFENFGVYKVLKLFFLEKKEEKKMESEPAPPLPIFFSANQSASLRWLHMNYT